MTARFFDICAKKAYREARNSNKWYARDRRYVMARRYGHARRLRCAQQCARARQSRVARRDMRCAARARAKESARAMRTQRAALFCCVKICSMITACYMPFHMRGAAYKIARRRRRACGMPCNALIVPRATRERTYVVLPQRTRDVVERHALLIRATPRGEAYARLRHATRRRGVATPSSLRTPSSSHSLFLPCARKCCASRSPHMRDMLSPQR